VQTFISSKVSYFWKLSNLRCLPDIDDPECPQCAKENATIRDLRNQQDEWAERQDLFRSHLRDSDDKFGVVANWFGKGVMNSIKLVDT
jgi:vacuolar protein sorting-associated protein 11